MARFGVKPAVPEKDEIKVVSEVKHGPQHLFATEHLKKSIAWAAGDNSTSTTTTPVKIQKVISVYREDPEGKSWELRVYVWNHMNTAYLIRHETDGLHVIVMEVNCGRGEHTDRRKLMHWIKTHFPSLMSQAIDQLEQGGY